MDERTLSTYTFCQRWISKARRYENESSLDQAFDKFFTLFVVFNRQYSLAAYKVGHNHRIERDDATISFPEWVGNDRIWMTLNTETGSKDMDDLRQLVRPDGPFFLYLRRPTRSPDNERNRDLYERLGQTEPVVAVPAVMEYLYQVRCNIFHGSKVFEERQLQILIPAIRCLERIINLGMARLQDDSADRDRT